MPTEPHMVHGNGDHRGGSEEQPKLAEEHISLCSFTRTEARKQQVVLLNHRGACYWAPELQAQLSAIWLGRWFPAEACRTGRAG